MSGRIYPRCGLVVIARLDNLRKRPAVFGHLTGLTVAAFDALAAQVVPAVEAAHKQKLDRLDRQRAVGGGDNFDLSTADQLLLTVTCPPHAIVDRAYPQDRRVLFPHPLSAEKRTD